MSFGVLHLAPLLPEFLDLHLSDATVDMIGDGFDAAIHIAVLPDSSLIARRLCGMARYLVGSPSYLKKHGRPRHPLHLPQHVCITCGHGTAAETWRFTHKNGKSASVRPSGPLRVNNGDAMMPWSLESASAFCPNSFCAMHSTPASWRDCLRIGRFLPAR